MGGSTCTCHKPTCWASCGTGASTSAGGGRMVSSSPINGAASAPPLSGAHIYHVCNYWNQVPAGRYRSRTRNPRAQPLLGSPRARDASRNVKQPNKQTQGLDSIKRVKGDSASAGNDRVQRDLLWFFCALRNFCLLSLHPKYSCPTMFPLFMRLNEYAGFAPVPSCQTNLANLP